MGMRCRVLCVILVVCWVLVPAGCSKKTPKSTSKREVRMAMDTIVAVQAEGQASAAAVAAAWQEMEQSVAALDRWQTGTDLRRVNEAAGGEAVPVAPLVLECLTAAIEVHGLSGGAFDPTIGPLIDLWREEGRAGRVPENSQIAQALKLVGLEQVELSDSGSAAGDSEASVGGTVRLPRTGMRLDFGGIAKGFIAQRMMEAMKRAGATGALVQAGGDVCAFGLRHTEGDPQDDGRWRVAVQDPRFPDDSSRHYTVIRVTNRAVSTSGHYQRYRIIDGKRYSHILDPRSGRPVPTGLASVTVVAPRGYLADGLATAIAVLGIEEGLQLVERTPDVECLLLEEVGDDRESSRPDANVHALEEVKLRAHRSSGFAALEVGAGRR